MDTVQKHLIDNVTIQAPVITIITAVYNGEEYLETLMKSIISQTDKRFEFIIIDGGSNDNTISIIKKYAKFISYYVSEPDNGIYDAWNKGIKISKSPWITFLGCDDELQPNFIEEYIKHINTIDDSIEYISSKMQMIDLRGNSIRVKGWPWSWPSFQREMTVAHPGSLHKKEMFEKYGFYNIDFKISADYELLLRAGDQLRASFMPLVTVKMSEGGASDSYKALNEQLIIAITTAGLNPIVAYWNYSINTLKFSLKKGLRKIGINVYLKK